MTSDRNITIDLSAPTELADLPRLGQAAFKWWVDELKEIAPGWAQRWFPKPPETATLSVSAGAWRVTPGGDDRRAFELDPQADDKGLADQILRAAPNFSLSHLTVVLPQSVVLRRRIDMPAMPERDLRSAVELQIDRLSPFKSDGARFAVRTVARDPAEGKLTADVAIAPRAAVEAIETRLTSLGITPSAIDVDSGNGAGAGFDLSAAKEQQTPRRALLINVGFACGATVMWYLAGAAWERASEREIGGWQARIAELRPLAQRSAALRQQLDGMTQPFEMARAHEPGRTLQIVAEVTKIAPNSVRLTELRIEGASVDLVGLASDAPSLISKLEASKLFSDVKFRSPVMRRAELNVDRFEISMKLEGRK